MRTYIEFDQLKHTLPRAMSSRVCRNYFLLHHIAPVSLMNTTASSDTNMLLQGRLRDFSKYNNQNSKLQKKNVFLYRTTYLVTKETRFSSSLSLADEICFK